MITVMGATGHTGKAISEALLEVGEDVRALGRSADKLDALRKAGAEIMAGDASDAAFLTEAFRGAHAVYTLLPPDPQSPDYRAVQDRVGEAISTAIRQSGVKYVVFLSSVGGDQPSGTGPIAGLHAQEERLRRLASTNIFILRAGVFFENAYGNLWLIKDQGINGGAVAPDLPIPMIATRDIAAVAAQALAVRDWKGVVVRELLGPRDYTYAEATRILGESIGKPDLKYVQFPYGELQEALVQMGMSENVAGLYAEMSRALNEGKVKARQARKPENTTPTEFEEFAGELAQAYRAI